MSYHHLYLMSLKQSSLKTALEKGFLFSMFVRQKYILKELYKPMAFMRYTLD